MEIVGSPRSKKLRAVRKVFTSANLDCQSVIPMTLREKHIQRRRGKFCRTVLLAQKSHAVMQRVSDLGFEILKQSYSPDLVPSDYYFFPQLRKGQKDRKCSFKKVVTLWRPG